MGVRAERIVSAVFLLAAFLAALSACPFALSFSQVSVLNGSGEGASEVPFVSPMGLFVDSADRLYVADKGANSVFVFKPDLSYQAMRGGTQGNLPTELDSPEGVWVAENGKLYIADTFNDRIQVYADYSGNFEKTIPSGSGESYALDKAKGVAVDPQGNVHVADTGHDRVSVFAPAGHFLASYYSAEAFGDFVFSRPGSIAVDAPRARILVSDTENDRVQVFSDNYSFIARLGWGSGELEFSRPEQVAVDALGRIYVADAGHDRVQVFSDNYSFLGSIRGSDFNFSAPAGVAVNAHGRVFISDPGAGKVVVLAGEGYGLEERFVENRLAIARAAVAAASAARLRALSAINGISSLSQGCVNLNAARQTLFGSDAGFAVANASLSRAEALYANRSYGNVSAEADNAALFAAQAQALAESAYAGFLAVNESAGSAADAMSRARSAVDEVDSLNSGAQALGLGGVDAYAITAMQELITAASSKCSSGDFAGAEASALHALGNATPALNSLTARFTAYLSPRYAGLKARLAAASSGSARLGLNLSFSGVQSLLSRANASMARRAYLNASSELGLAETGLAPLEALVGNASARDDARAAAVAAGINASMARLAEMKAIEDAYRQPSGEAGILAALGTAQGNLSAGNVSSANDSLSYAIAMIDAENASLQEKVEQVDAALEAIFFAEADVESASAASLPLLSADVSGARADLEGARALAYSEPLEALRLAESASFKASGEAERIGPMRTAYFFVVGVAAMAAVLGAVLFACAAAVAAYKVRKRMKRGKAEAEKASREKEAGNPIRPVHPADSSGSGVRHDEAPGQGEGGAGPGSGPGSGGIIWW